MRKLFRGRCYRSTGARASGQRPIALRRQPLAGVPWHGLTHWLVPAKLDGQPIGREHAGMYSDFSGSWIHRWCEHRPIVWGVACWATLFAIAAPLPSAEDAHHGDDLPLQLRPGETQAEAYDRFVEEKLKLTYPATAARMLGECGGIREGICLDLGCGSGHLDVELAKRSKFQIIGLDLDPNMQPLFEKRMREAGLDKRVSYVQGDAQKLPFPNLPTLN